MGLCGAGQGGFPSAQPVHFFICPERSEGDERSAGCRRHLGRRRHLGCRRHLTERAERPDFMELVRADHVAHDFISFPFISLRL